MSLPANSEFEKIELQKKLELLDSKSPECSQITDRPRSFENANKPPIDINELFIKSSADLESKSPLNCLIDNLLSFREISKALFDELHSIESITLSHISNITQSGNPFVNLAGSGSDKSLESKFIDLIQRIDSIEKLLSNYNSSMENLLTEENSHSKQLEKSLKWLAKQNYQLEKAQLNVGIAHGACRNRSGEMNIKRSPGPLGSTKLSQEMKAVTNERLLMSNEQETDEEFYECEDNNSNFKYPSSNSSNISDKTITTPALDITRIDSDRLDKQSMESKGTFLFVILKMKFKTSFLINYYKLTQNLHHPMRLKLLRQIINLNGEQNYRFPELR